MEQPIKPPSAETILVVEDEPEVAFVLERLLRHFFGQYTILLVSTAALALAFIEQHTVALVISDYTMQPMNGLELTISLKQRLPQLPVLLITGADLERLTDDAYAAGVDGILAKPFTGSELQRIVRVILDIPV